MKKFKTTLILNCALIFSLGFIYVLILQLNGPGAINYMLPNSVILKSEKNKIIELASTANDRNLPQKFEVPDITKLDKSPLSESILRGKNYLENTHKLLPKFVGANMNCTNCHLNSGTKPNAGPWVGITTRFPQYRARSAKVDTLPDRVNDCFERSLNGKRLPENSAAMTDIISYMTFLSQGYLVGGEIKGSGMPRLKLDRIPDIEVGKKIYTQKCSICHQPNGEGLFSKEGKVIYPALWGKKSFNIGAGMARLHTAAGFVKNNMPLGQDNSLSDEEAWDVAAFFTQQPRPDFTKKVNDWLKGDKPKDARY